MKDFWNDIEQYGNSYALIDDMQRLTYYDLISRADSLGNYLQPRTLCFLFAQNDMESIIGYIAMLRKKVVPVMINPEIDYELYQKLLNIYQPQYIWKKAEPSDNLNSDYTGGGVF